MNDYEALMDYKLIEFAKINIDIVKRIKDYSIRNCRKIISSKYITYTLHNFDYGLAYFRTEILNKTNEHKNRPCAFACVKFVDENLFLLLICSVKNNDHLGTKILQEVFNLAKRKGIYKILLECNSDNVNFYKKFNFIEEDTNNEKIIQMIKYLN
jgi:hypothetical protein